MILNLATSNEGKIKELDKMIIAEKLDVIQLRKLSEQKAQVQEQFNPVENGTSFQANALIKARALFNLVNDHVLAEDSGIEVSCLGNRPGVLSARYAETDEARNQKLLREISEGNFTDRSARYVASICYIDNFGNEMFFHGTVSGIIAEQPTGKQGFGYDPLFFFPAFGSTFGAVTSEKKASVSHRGKAFKNLVNYLKKINT
jgi:XTP/dITP diphosphohydrolase